MYHVSLLHTTTTIYSLLIRTAHLKFPLSYYYIFFFLPLFFSSFHFFSINSSNNKKKTANKTALINFIFISFKATGNEMKKKKKKNKERSNGEKKLLKKTFLFKTFFFSLLLLVVPSLKRNQFEEGMREFVDEMESKRRKMERREGECVCREVEKKKSGKKESGEN